MSDESKEKSLTAEEKSGEVVAFPLPDDSHVLTFDLEHRR